MVGLVIGDLWGNMIGLPNDGNVIIKAMSLKLMVMVKSSGSLSASNER